MIDKKLIEEYFDRLWPLNRSLTGEDVRETHRILSDLIPLKTFEIKSGTQVNDWVIPQEWYVNEAYIEAPSGKRICQFSENNLNLVGYSTAFEGELTKKELDDHLHYLPNNPNAIPYVTSYYKSRWGFCISYNEYKKLEEGNYKVVVDTKHFKGSMTISDCLIKGKSDKEILFTSYTCHPSMAINELSGPLVLAFLYKKISKIKNLRYTYRFVLAPETIGSIAYLDKYGDHFKKKLIAGYNIDRIGLKNSLRYQFSKKRDTIADNVIEYVIKNINQSNFNISLKEFVYGESDDRQYNSIGYELPVGLITCDDYSEYHTSLDNKDLICFNTLSDIINILFKAVNIIESNHIYKNNITKGEPFLTKYGLQSTLGNTTTDYLLALKCLIFHCDGERSLLEISKKYNIRFNQLFEIAEACVKRDLFSRLST